VADSSYVVPAGGGAVTSFSFESTVFDAGSQVDFLVLRPVGGDDYTVVGNSGLVTLAGTGLETFPASVQTQAGDILGEWEGDVQDCIFAGGGTVLGSPTSDPAVGVTVTIPVLAGGLDVNESATLLNFGLTKTSSGGGSSATSAVGAATQGQPLTYTLAYSNNSGGGTSSPSTTVQDTLPTGSQFTNASSGCSYSNAGPTAGTLNGQSTGGLVTCAAGTVADGANGSFTIVALPRSTGTNTNTAVVESATTSVSPVASESDVVAVPANSTCGTTPGHTFTGSITINSGTSCLINNTTVTGSINLHAGGGLVLTNSTLAASLNASGATVLTLCGDHVGGSASISGSTGRVVVGSDDGDCGTTGGNTLAASVSLSSNHNGLELYGNTVGGSLSATGNNGGATGEVDIESNSIAGALACSSNTPPPTNNGLPNTAAVKSGQCSTL
jgi:uncharacterized repeat protein (TIGR01451 family)